MELKEIIETEFTILSEKKTSDGEVMNIRAPFIVVDQKNKNGRTYPKALLQREIDRVQDAISRGSFLGSGDHNPSGLTTLKDASHIVTKLELDDAGKGWAEMKVIPTERGKTIQTIVRNKGSLGLSIRGFGNVSPSGQVMDDYFMTGIDVVTNPSEPQAVFNKDNVFESVDFEDEEDRKADLREAYDNLLSDSYDQAVADGMWYGDFESYKKKFGNPVKEVLLLKNDEKKELTEEQRRAKLASTYQESVTAGFKGTFDEWKEKYPNIVEFVSKPIKPEPSLKEKKVVSAYQESVDAGFRGNFAEWKAKYPNIVATVNKKQLTEDERAAIVARENNTTVERVKKIWAIDKEQKFDKSLRKKAVSNVNQMLAGSGASVSPEKLEKMISEELEVLKRRKDLNWKAFERLLK